MTDSSDLGGIRPCLTWSPLQSVGSWPFPLSTGTAGLTAQACFRTHLARACPSRSQSMTPSCWPAIAPPNLSPPTLGQPTLGLLPLSPTLGLSGLPPPARRRCSARPYLIRSQLFLPTLTVQSPIPPPTTTVNGCNNQNNSNSSRQAAGCRTARRCCSNQHFITTPTPDAQLRRCTPPSQGQLTKWLHPNIYHPPDTPYPTTTTNPLAH